MKKRVIITEEDIIRQTICLHINWWIQRNQDCMYTYGNAIDRCMDMADAYKEGMKEALEAISKYEGKFPLVLEV
jgi:hypothetical protein